MSEIQMVRGYEMPRGARGMEYGNWAQRGSIRYPTDVYAAQVAQGQQPNPYTSIAQLGGYCGPCLGEDPGAANLPDAPKSGASEVNWLGIALAIGGVAWWMNRKRR